MKDTVKAKPIKIPIRVEMDEESKARAAEMCDALEDMGDALHMFAEALGRLAFGDECRVAGVEAEEMPLAPCPHCGSGGYLRSHSCASHDGAGMEWWVYCHRCRSMGPVEDTQERAGIRWNTRYGMTTEGGKSNAER